MRNWVGFALSFFVAILVGTNTYAAPITDHVVINEIMANPATGEVEWIELYNPTDAAVDMNGWRLVVTSGNFSGVFASDAVIAPHGYVVRSATDTTSKLNNTSATIVLKPSATGVAIDTVVYSGIAQAKTYARECDGSDIWVAQAVPTKALANCTVVPPPPKDVTPPIIAEITGTKLSGYAHIAISASDEGAVAKLQAKLVQYGSEIVSSDVLLNGELALDTTTLPNGPAVLEVLAVDAAGNSAVKTFTMEVENTAPAQTPILAPVAEPAKASAPVVPPPQPTPAEQAPPVPIQLPTVPVTSPTVRAATIAVTVRASPTATPVIARAVPTQAAVVPTQSLKSGPTSLVADSPSDTALVSGGTRAKSSLGPSTHQPVVTIIAPAAALVFCGILYALWRYRRRTKP